MTVSALPLTPLASIASYPWNGRPRSGKVLGGLGCCCISLGGAARMDSCVHAAWRKERGGELCTLQPHTSRKEGGRGEDGCGNVVTRRPDSWLGPVTPPHTTCVRTAHSHELELADLEYRASSDSTLFDSHQALPMLARSHAAVRSPKDCGTFRRYLFMHRQVQRPID